MFAGAQPDFWWGLLFVFVFYFLLNVAPPPMGRIDPLLTAPQAITGFMTIDTLLQGRFDAFLSALHHLMLPVLTLVYVVSGAIVKMVRTNTLRALQSDYILYARASGLPEAQVARYALRAALTPAITLVGNSLQRAVIRSCHHRGRVHNGRYRPIRGSLDPRV